VDKIRWLRTKVAHAIPGASGSEPSWDAPQFLFEVVTKDGGAALSAALGSLHEPGGVDLITALLPALALADVREALDREPANQIFMRIASPTAFLAWKQVPQRISGPPGSPSGIATIHDACIVAAHCVDLLPDAFAILPIAALVLAAKASAEAAAAGGGGGAGEPAARGVPSAAALLAAAHTLEAKNEHACVARADAEAAAAADSADRRDASAST
jgi:hypothetical protein